ncbi:uncharacterized protein TRAVEDRAFT_50267 [Trametes versicolor FP-101664 SS1]|uniref:uncharacterized protein n=1 Tax=Trametes versicolor (strain FP-101664) TaxID=717944 RepID=UPI00046214C6|nr:uncharacterized protein TRAVEDRAFT_50267 [Trametes versicolor FP-101664 SS1]EIW55785.1 hypothetical protein TRAVEDRAFT_50267 [Trametes versicolor FP-101664 SS1]
MPAEPSQQTRKPDYCDDRYFDEKMDLARPVDVPELDRDEMGVDFVLATDGTKWKRYRFSSVPVGQTFLAHQRANIRDGTGPRMGQSVAGSMAVGYKHIGIALQHTHLTETTVAMAAHAAESTIPTQPLWFFVLQLLHDGDQDAVQPSNVLPCGFWSLEEHPASIPEDIILDPTPQFERIGKHTVAPLSTWKQMLGDLSFTIQTKMYTYILGLGNDEMLVLRELQKHHDFTSDSDFSDEESAPVDVDVTEPRISGVLGHHHSFTSSKS